MIVQKKKKKDRFNRLELKFLWKVRNESEKFNGIDKRAVGVMSYLLYKGNGHYMYTCKLISVDIYWWIDFPVYKRLYEINERTVRQAPFVSIELK